MRVVRVQKRWLKTSGESLGQYFSHEQMSDSHATYHHAKHLEEFALEALQEWLYILLETMLLRNISAI